MTDLNLTTARLGVLAALHEGDAGVAHQLVTALMADGYPFARLLDELLAPIQSESGRRWLVGDYTIAEEHASTAAAETLVATLAGAFDQPADGTHVLVACAEDEAHTLPARMAAALLLAEGHRVTFLGSSVPAADLVEFTRDLEPDAAVVSCTLTTHLLGARATVRALHDAGVPVLVGGAAFGTDARRAHLIGADAWVASLSELPGLLEGWAPSPVDAEAGAVPIGAEVRALEDDAPGVAQRLTVALLERHGDGGDRSRLLAVRADAEQLHAAATTATWLGDPDLLADHARWFASLLDAQGRASTAADLLDAYEAALEGRHPVAADVLAGARARLDAAT